MPSIIYRISYAKDCIWCILLSISYAKDYINNILYFLSLEFATLWLMTKWLHVLTVVAALPLPPLGIRWAGFWFSPKVPPVRATLYKLVFTLRFRKLSASQVGTHALHTSLNDVLYLANLQCQLRERLFMPSIIYQLRERLHLMDWYEKHI
jgi:hypothetical protein